MQNHLRKCSRKQPHSFVIIICLNKKPNNNGFTTSATKFTLELLTVLESRFYFYFNITYTACQSPAWCSRPKKAHWNTEQSVRAKENQDSKGFNHKNACMRQNFFFPPFFKQERFLLTLFLLQYFKKHQKDYRIRRKGRHMYLVYPQQEWNSKCPKNLFVEMCHCD